ncbi:MAG: PHP domain-containing protein [Acidobacteriota bacterium]
MIDLHLHTTASDGSLTPSALVARAAAAGLTTLSITDHDTLDGLEEGSAAARAAGLRLITGVEITAIAEGCDVHLLGYFVDPADAALTALLERQRADRLRRLRAIADRLAALGASIDIDALVASAADAPGRSVGRPKLADALVEAGHARDRTDAFDRLLGNGCPAYVPRIGPAPAEVIALVAAAGGVVSMAHPGVTARDESIPGLAAAGLAALEARHSDHDADTEARYRRLAARHGLAVSGGSDFHGDAGHRPPSMLGRVTLAAEDLAALEARRPR